MTTRIIQVAKRQRAYVIKRVRSIGDAKWPTKYRISSRVKMFVGAKCTRRHFLPTNLAIPS
jgi:hypothetical protein